MLLLNVFASLTQHNIVHIGLTHRNGRMDFRNGTRGDTGIINIIFSAEHEQVYKTEEKTIYDV